mmetsp:Transcript_65155/g.187529  ORF Transcript_65155/g.187529 Transcript_65155/m.187529 type:complete len:247 (+) Transcript_65155:1188-1928(+)
MSVSASPPLGGTTPPEVPLSRNTAAKRGGACLWSTRALGAVNNGAAPTCVACRAPPLEAPEVVWWRGAWSGNGHRRCWPKAEGGANVKLARDAPGAGRAPTRPLPTAPPPARPAMLCWEAPSPSAARPATSEVGAHGAAAIPCNGAATRERTKPSGLMACGANASPAPCGTATASAEARRSWASSFTQPTTAPAWMAASSLATALLNCWRGRSIRISALNAPDRHGHGRSAMAEHGEESQPPSRGW